MQHTANRRQTPTISENPSTVTILTGPLPKRMAIFNFLSAKYSENKTSTLKKKKKKNQYTELE